MTFLHLSPLTQDVLPFCGLKTSQVYVFHVLNPIFQLVIIYFFILGAIPLPFQLRLEGSVEKPAAGGSDKTIWQPEERSQ